MVAVRLSAQSIVTVAGGGTVDGQLATAVPILRIDAITIDAAGNVYYGDLFQHKVFKVTKATGRVTTIAGSGAPGNSGDGRPAVHAVIEPGALAVDAAGNAFIDSAGTEIRRVDGATGIITTFAGGGSDISDDIPATNAQLQSVGGLTLRGNYLYFSDYTGIRRVDLTSNLMTRVPGIGYGAFGIAFDETGNLYVADFINNVVREINVNTGQSVVVAGGGNPADGIGDGLPATSAKLNQPSNIALSPTGDLYIFNPAFDVVRRVDAQTKIITTVAKGV